MLIFTRSNIAPVKHSVVRVLYSTCAIREREETVADLVAVGTFFHMFKITERVFVFDLGAFIAGESDSPVRGIDSFQDLPCCIPLRQATIQAIERSRDVNEATRGIGAGGHSDREDHTHRA